MKTVLTTLSGEKMISATNSALSGLQAFGTKINSNANNVANASTDGYKKTRVLMSSQEPQGVQATVQQVNSPGSMRMEETNEGSELVEGSNVELAEELPESQLNSRFYQANLKTIEATDEMTASLLSIKA